MWAGTWVAIGIIIGIACAYIGKLTNDYLYNVQRAAYETRDQVNIIIKQQHETNKKLEGMEVSVVQRLGVIETLCMPEEKPTPASETPTMENRSV